MMVSHRVSFLAMLATKAVSVLGKRSPQYHDTSMHYSGDSQTDLSDSQGTYPDDEQQFWSDTLSEDSAYDGGCTGCENPHCPAGMSYEEFWEQQPDGSCSDSEYNDCPRDDSDCPTDIHNGEFRDFNGPQSRQEAAFDMLFNGIAAAAAGVNERRNRYNAEVTKKFYPMDRVKSENRERGTKFSTGKVLVDITAEKENINLFSGNLPDSSQLMNALAYQIALERDIRARGDDKFKHRKTEVSKLEKLQDRAERQGFNRDQVEVLVSQVQFGGLDLGFNTVTRKQALRFIDAQTRDLEDQHSFEDLQRELHRAALEYHSNDSALRFIYGVITGDEYSDSLEQEWSNNVTLC